MAGAFIDINGLTGLRSYTGGQEVEFPSGKISVPKAFCGRGMCYDDLTVA